MPSKSTLIVEGEQNHIWLAILQPPRGHVWANSLHAPCNLVGPQMSERGESRKRLAEQPHLGSPRVGQMATSRLTSRKSPVLSMENNIRIGRLEGPHARTMATSALPPWGFQILNTGRISENFTKHEDEIRSANPNTCYFMGPYRSKVGASSRLSWEYQVLKRGGTSEMDIQNLQP